MKKSELKALIREVIKETHIHQAMTDMVKRDTQKRKEQEYKSKLEKYYQAARGHFSTKQEYESDVRSFGKSLGYSDSEINNDLNRYTKPENEPSMNNFIFESKLKALIREVIEEISVNEPASNPSYKDVKVGDKYISKDIMRFGDTTWVYVSTVLEVEPISKRFGEDDRVVSVKVESYNLQTGETKTIDDKKKIWVSQLLQGLV